MGPDLATLKAMQFGETMNVGQFWEVLRVEFGWVYHHKQTGGACFVPEDSGVL